MSKDLAIVGPTASGKSALAMELARRLGDVELVSVDSMQVYRGMDIGTAKPTLREQAEVPHHMLDLADPSQDLSVAEFTLAARAVIDEVHNHGRRVLFVGGTGLYFRCVVDGFELPGQFPDVLASMDGETTASLYGRLVELDPLGAARMEPTNRRRITRALEVTIGSGSAFSSFGPGFDAYPEIDVTILGVWTPRSVGAARIEARVDAMLAAGWLHEVEVLRKGGGLSKTAAQALGYKELLAHSNGETDIGSARDQIVARTRSFARRQRMWFRRDPRVRWHAVPERPESLLDSMLEECPQEVSDESPGGDAA